MRLLLRFLLAITLVAYGAMPSMGMAIDGDIAAHSTGGMATGMQAADHGAHLMAMPQTTGADCPHDGRAGQKGHCAICMSLAAMPAQPEAMPLLRSAPLPGISASLVSRVAAPLDPPPRA